MKWLAAAVRCSILFVAVLATCTGDFIALVWPDEHISLLFIGLAASVPLLVVSLEAVFRLRWKWIATFLAAWLIIVPPLFGFSTLSIWLGAQGFHLHSLLVQNYLARCRLTEFVENGVKQSAGFCQGIDEGAYFAMIVYDTSGQVILPVAQRTPEWKQVDEPG